VFGAIEDQRFAEDVAAALIAVVNRALSADRVDPCDLDRVRSVSTRALATVSLGLEYLSDGSIEGGVRVLAGTPLITIFRVGFSLTVELARLAQRLHQRGVDDPNLDPLLTKRPLFPRAFDTPPFAGGRPFRSLSDVHRVRRYLEETYAEHLSP